MLKLLIFRTLRLSLCFLLICFLLASSLCFDRKSETYEKKITKNYTFLNEIRMFV